MKTYTQSYVKIPVLASILVKTDGYVLSEPKQLRKKPDVCQCKVRVFGLKETAAFKYLLLSAIFNLCSEEHYCFILQLITFLHLSTSVIDFISNFVVFIHAVFAVV